MVQIPQIRTDIEELDKYNEEINNRFDQITRALNDLYMLCEENEDDDETEIVMPVEDAGTVYKYISGKFIKLGKMNLTNVPNGSLFEDQSDGVLKYKDHSGTVTSLT